MHHKDGNKLNFHFTNLFIVGSADHGWVSAKQAHFMRYRDERLKAEFDAFIHEQEAQQTTQIAKARNDGVPWAGLPDGEVRRQYEEAYGQT